MPSGIIGFVLGAVLVVIAGIIFQILVIRNAAPDLDYRFGKYVFADKEFPWSYLDQGRVLTRFLFPVRIKVTYYDAQYHEVKQADKPGRYGAVVRISLNGGVVQYRYITLFRTPAITYWSNGPATVSATLPPGTGIDPAVLSNQAAEIGVALKDGFFGEANVSSNLSVLLAGLYETSPNDPPAVRRTNFYARDADWWFGLRERLGLAQKYPMLVDLPHDYDADPAKRWSLILLLHGGSQRGTDLRALRTEDGLPKLIAEGKQVPAIVVSPQLPFDESWQTQVLAKLLDEISAKYRVDPDRVYLVGQSLGGDAVWDLAMVQPERFAAIVPIAGEGDFADAARIKDLPTWTFEGMKDTIVPPINVTDMVNALRKAGGHPHMTLYPDVGHSSWNNAYATEALYTWLFAQKRGQPEVITPGLPTP
jgi:acetyl esterase/lipase